MRKNRQLGTEHASGERPVSAREEGGAFKRPKEVMGDFGIILLPWEEEISVGKERSGMPPRELLDMVGGLESGTL